MSSEQNPTAVESPSSRRSAANHGGEDPELIGTVLNDTYRVERVVGEGGMSRVYEARHTRIAHKRYALKVLNADLSTNKELLERFQREADAVASLKHDSIVEVFDVGLTPEGVPYMVYEFLDGQDLAILLESVKRLDALVAVRVARRVAAALAAAHESGVVHRDLKPENVFLLGMTADPEVKVIDFGLSRFVDGSRSTVTRAGVVMGTPSYMSPEQARGERGDHRTDIYGVGAILYTAVTGHPPFEEESPQQTILAVMSRDPQRPKVVEPTVPESVELVIQRAMAREPNDRYQQMTDLLAALTTLEEQLSMSKALPAARPTQASIVALEAEDDVRWGRVRLAALLMAAVGVSALIAILAAIGLATSIAKRELTNTELLLTSLGVLGTALTPVVLVAARVRRKIWNNSAKVVDAVTAIRLPLISALVGYGVVMLALRCVRYVTRESWPSAWIGWDLALFVIAATWALATYVNRRVGRRHERWARVLAAVGVRVFAVGVTLSTVVLGLRAMKPLPTRANLAALQAEGETPALAGSTPVVPSASMSAGPAASATAPIQRSLEGEVAEAMKGGLPALRTLAERHPDEPQVLRAWAVQAASEGGDPKEALVAFTRLFEKAPAQVSDDTLRPLLMKLAHTDDSAAVLDLMANKMGSRGPDLLYELYLSSPQLREAAKALLESPDNRQRFNNGLAIAFDLRNAPSCAARLALLPRAKNHGDERAISALQVYSTGTKKGCGRTKRKPCPPPCAAEAAAFRKTITQIRDRLEAEKQKAEPKP
ncbi:MAG: serine/threonine-protein kinase [Polyangiaceae bacterium]